MTLAENHADYYRGLEAAHDALAEHANEDPAGLAGAVHRALTPLLSDTPTAAQRACRSGCAHCCHFPVGITYPETLRLLDALESNQQAQHAVRQEHAATAASSWAELAGRPCPLLRDGRCGAYTARPMACRALASTDAAACEAALAGHATVPVDDAAFVRGLGAICALGSGNPAGTRELRHALAAVLDAPPDAREAAFGAARSQ